MGSLDVFSPATRRWFEQTFATPTPAQERGWPAIARGGHVLIQAPTGSLEISAMSIKLSATGTVQISGASIMLG